MQKKIIALAVAGLMSGAAFAQSNVTIYGVADMGYVHSSSGNSASKSSNEIDSGNLSGSRLGFKGTEDLGNGLKAVWTFEFGTLTLDGAGAGTNAIGNTRQTFVGLSGNFGTVVAGRLQTPGYNFAAKYDTMGASIFSPVNQLSDNPTVGGGIGLSISARDALGRQDNAVAYVSPNLSGFTIVGAYAAGEQARDNVAGTDPMDVWALSVDYDMGPLSVGFTHHNVNDFGGVSGTDQTENAFGVNYDFGIAKLSASYQTSKTDAGGTNVANVKLYNIGARFKAGSNGTVGVSYARLTDKNMGAGTADGRAAAWGVDYQYAFSKRTTGYAGYTRMTNNNNLAYDLLNSNANPAAGDRVSQFGFGLRHTF